MRMHIFTRPVCLVAVTALLAASVRPPARGRRHVDVRPSSAAGHSAAVRLHRHHGVARSPAPVERAIQRRRLRLVRVARRPRADESSRGARTASEAVDAPEELRRRRLLRAHARRGNEVHRPRAERPDVVSKTSRARVGGRREPAPTPQAALEARRAEIAAIEEGEPRRHRPALRRRDALPGRAVLALPVQEVHRRPAGVRARAADGLLRRRSRQLHVSRVTTSTSRSSASTRTARRSAPTTT